MADAAFGTTLFILFAGFVGMAFALRQFRKVAAVKLSTTGILRPLLGEVEDASQSSRMERLITIYEAIREGADSFLFAEYKICFAFIVCFGAIVFVLTSFVDVDGKVEKHWVRNMHVQSVQ